jgi:hypothetical protein
VGGQLDVDPQALLQSRYLPKQLIRIRLEAQIDIDRGSTPPLDNRGRPASQIDPCGSTCYATQRASQLP